jgi:hypothetical protein
MAKSSGILRHAEAGAVGFAWQSAGIEAWWCRRREASLNWLALGLLLAAWNASEDGPARAPRRPASLRGYSSVSVRAAASVRAATLDATQVGPDFHSKGHKSVNVL